jgi:hypothetical protein
MNLPPEQPRQIVILAKASIQFVIDSQDLTLRRFALWNVLDSGLRQNDGVAGECLILMAP